MSKKFSISTTSILTLEVQNYELADKLREIAEENGGAVGENNLLIFVPDLERYHAAEIKELYEEAKKLGSWLWVQIML